MSRASSTERGAEVAAGQRRALVACVLSKLSGRRGELPPSAAETLVERYVASMAEEDLESSRPEDLCGAILSLLELAWRRRPGQVEIRLLNPTLEEHGWSSEHTIIELVNDDMPFLVDSLTAALNQRELGVHQVVHPQYAVRRAADGTLRDVLDPTAGKKAPRESFMHLEIDPQRASAQLLEIEAHLRRVLGDVRAAVEDWQAMRRKVTEVVERLRAAPPPSVPEEELEESLLFLDWVHDNHFTFLAYRRYRLLERDGDEYLRPLAESGLGLARSVSLGARVGGEKPLLPAIRAFFRGPKVLSISKSNHRSTVHRPVHMDLISVKRFDRRGRVVGEDRITGLFTSTAYTLAASEIPLVRKKVRRVLERSAFLPASHDAKALRAILDHYSRDELFQISEDDLYRFAHRILKLQLRPRLALLVRYDEADRFASCMVYVPRDRHNTERRLRMQELLEEAFGGSVTAYYTRLSDRPLAQLHFIVRLESDKHRQVDVAALEQRLAAVARSWGDRLREVMVERHGEEHGLVVWRRYRDAFPVPYQAHASVDDAVEDAAVIDRVLECGSLGMRLYRVAGAAASRFHFRTFELAVPAPVSIFLPMLENMGLEVLSEIPFEVRPADAVHPIWIRDFELQAPIDVDLEGMRERFQEAFARVWTGEVENDDWNRLVLRAGLTWREAVMLRAYARYLRQAGVAFSQRYMVDTLVRYPQITRTLMRLFHTQLDPRRGKGEKRSRALARRVRRQLEGVERLDEDRILRHFLLLIRRTLRTNYYQAGGDGEPKSYLSFKLDASAIPFLPQPRPRYEIYVYAPRFEAVHLRGGKVARGGIRWSDRREDFRTEILGLVKAQMVKNAVIVPVGAKGGFVLKQPPAEGGREALEAEARLCYQEMIRGLLDLTDNYRGEDVVPPPDAVRRDDDDPYLVVAADKGTATFSDLANEVAAEYDFWLGDAFASGGSAGYDHKKMGITARGAWESVKDHFRHLDVDVQRDVFTAVGVGDMSGDVFGNGMLQSETLKLVGAFNHLHVFVDPDPDPATSYAERRRLFDARLGWDGYDRDKLSPGGAVFDRHAKRITVSEEVKARFGLADVKTTPAALIRALLTADVDLLWLGGIGTYVKARAESHLEVGDRANDEVRVDGGDLRAKVVAEGANLGFTQAGRIEYARAGGRINTDFIDNSAGVDTSDHEVNIKIVLQEAMAAGELDRPARDRLLEEMTDEVAALVLRDNYQQARSLSFAAAHSAESIDDHLRLMHDLEREVKLNRQLEGLPDDASLLERRDGLTRPELAVLLAYSKIAVYNQLLDSDLPDEPELEEDLVRYFPAPMQRRYRPLILRHRLRRELIATHVTNSMINRVGPAFVARTAALFGRTVSDVARAYTAARDVFEVRTVWEGIEGLDNRVPFALQLELTAEVVRLLERVTRWFLRYGPRPLEVAACVADYHADVLVLAAQIEDLLPARARRMLRERYRRLHKKNVPLNLARHVASLALLPASCDVVRVARATGVGVERVGQIYFAVGERFHVDRLGRAARRVRAEDRWQKAAVGGALEDLYAYQAALARQVVEVSDGKPKKAIDAWIAARPEAVTRLDQLVADVDATGKLEPAVLIVAARELRRLVEG